MMKVGLLADSGGETSRMFKSYIEILTPLLHNSHFPKIKECTGLTMHDGGFIDKFKYWDIKLPDLLVE